MKTFKLPAFAIAAALSSSVLADLNAVSNCPTTRTDDNATPIAASELTSAVIYCNDTSGVRLQTYQVFATDQQICPLEYTLTGLPYQQLSCFIAYSDSNDVLSGFAPFVPAVINHVEVGQFDLFPDINTITSVINELEAPIPECADWTVEVTGSCTLKK